MSGALFLAVLAVVAAGYLFHNLRMAVLGSAFLIFSWRWLTGMPLSGADPETLRHPWWQRRRWQRAGHRAGATFGLFAVIYGLLTDFWLTVALCLTALFCGLILGCWLLWLRFAGLPRERRWHRPLHFAAHELAGWPRAVRASSWIAVVLDESGAVREARLKLPQGWQADPRDEQRLIGMAAAKLAIEAPEPSWRRAGPAPQLVLTHSEPAPPFIEYGKGTFGEQLHEAVMRASADEIVLGLGKPHARRYPPVGASLKLDSPHFLENMGSGGGKSEMAAFVMMQWLRRGGVVMVLDNKWHSQPWAFKDEFAEFAYLPNVAYLQSVEQIHAGLVWLGEERARRDKVTTRAVDALGRMHGAAGPPVLVVCEELNLVVPLLKDYWTEIREKRDPKKSPALRSLASVSFAGRAVRIHLLLIGQMLTAEATGSRDSSVKANIGVKIMARYDPPGWGTAVGKNVPMPPPSDVLGRIQVVSAGRVREAQAPKADYLLYRELATSGIMTPCPAGMPRIGPVPIGHELPAGAPDLLVVPGTFPSLGPPEAVSLSEAAWRIVPRSKDALRKASQRPGFPTPVGIRGQAYLYDPRALAEWDAARRLQQTGRNR